LQWYRKSTKNGSLNSRPETLENALPLSHNYKIYYVETAQLQVPHIEGAADGDLAVLLDGEHATGYYFKGGYWRLEVGNHVGNRKSLIKFPHEHWSVWVLHGSGKSLRWVNASTLRKKEKRLGTPNPTTTISIDPNTDQSSEAAVLPTDEVAKMPSFTPSPSPSPSPPAHSPAKNLISKIITEFHRVFPKSPEFIERCTGPLRLLLQANFAEIPVKAPGHAKKDGLYPDQHLTMLDLVNNLLKNERDQKPVVIEDCFRDCNPEAPPLVAHLAMAMFTESKGLEGKKMPVALGTINVPEHKEGSAVITIDLPTHLQDSGLSSKVRVQGGFPDLTSVLTSLGYLTEPHTDYHGIKQLILHAGSEKLWLVWPPTRANLEIAFWHMCSHTRSRDFTIAKALELLTSLEIQFCTEQDEWFSLDPFAIHACICVMASCHKNKLCVDYGSFNKWVETYSLYVDTLVAVHRVHGNDKDERRKVIEQLQNSLKCFLHWEALLQEKSNHPSAVNTRA
jgi:hypothetical protein